MVCRHNLGAVHRHSVGDNVDGVADSLLLFPLFLCRKYAACSGDVCRFWQRLGCCWRTADDGGSVTGVRH